MLVLCFILMDLFRPDLVLLAIYLSLYPYLYLTGRSQWIYRLIISSGVALAWMILAGGMYQYRVGMMNLFGMNLFTLLAWALGLYAAYTFFLHLNRIFNIQGTAKRMLLFLSIYWPMLIIVESIAYHVLLFRNIQTLAYPGLPLCDCIHAPFWMQFAYFAMGPVYYALCERFAKK